MLAVTSLKHLRRLPLTKLFPLGLDQSTRTYCVQTRRYMGDLEHLFFNGKKLIPSMMNIECTRIVEKFHIELALEKLALSHPMLRMVIRKDKNGPYFEENDNITIPLYMCETDDLYRVAQEQYIRHFEDGRSEMWRFNLLQSECNTNLQCVFSFHHCAFDWPYSYFVIMEFLQRLKDVQRGQVAKIYPSYTWQPNCEQLENLKFQSKKLPTEIQCNLRTTQTTAISALDAYEHYFSEEIDKLSTTSKVIAAFENTTFDKEITQKYSMQSKARNISNTSAVSSALVVSFAKLLQTKGCNEKINVEFAFWTNLRRYMDIPEFYTGMSVVPCSVSALVDTSKNSLENDFWEIAGNINNQIAEIINSKDPIRVLHEDIPRWLRGERKRGKSQNAFTLSNVENVSLSPELQNFFRYNKFKVIADVDKDYSPIFLTLTSILDGCLRMGSAYTSTYTSEETAKTFMSINRHVLNCVYS